MKKLSELANIGVKAIGSFIFFVLSFYSLRYTYKFLVGEAELPELVHDSLVANMLSVIIILLLSAAVLRFRDTLTNKVTRLAFWTVLLWLAVCFVWWIQSAERPPLYDSQKICDAVENMMSGNYETLLPGNYMNMWPHQLGLAAVIELIYRVGGVGNYPIYQWMCGVMAIGVFVIGFFMLEQLAVQKVQIYQVLYCLFMCFCFPLIFYTTWVYGEIPYLFLSFLGFWLLLRYEKSGRKRYLFWMVLCYALAVMFRMNAWILIIATIISLLVHFLTREGKRDWYLIVITVLLVAIPLIWNQMVRGIYYGRAQEALQQEVPKEGIPSMAYIALGMSENDFMLGGWFEYYHIDVYAENGYDKELASEQAKEKVRDRLGELMRNPSHAVDFYKTKVMSQWNTPLYQSLFFSAREGFGLSEPGTLLYWLCFEEGYDILLWLSDRLHFLVFLGTAFYFLLAIRKSSSILSQTFGIALIGYFLFSVMWEAKSRYIFPVYVMMFPLAVIGWERLLYWMIHLPMLQTLSVKISSRLKCIDV